MRSEVLLVAWLLARPAPAPAAPAPAGPEATYVLQPAARVVVPAGPFPMGASGEAVAAAKERCAAELRAGGALLADLSSRCGSRFDVEGPEQTVSLPRYAIDRTEVTAGAYASCVKAGRCPPSLDRALANLLAGDPRRPVERVTWHEAATYCRFVGGRLPTEAEWEKAARGPRPRRYPWGDHLSSRRANHGRAERLAPEPGGPRAPGAPEATASEPFDDEDGFRDGAPVGSFPAGASPYGLLDMAGNVWEWTSGVFSREPPQAAGRLAPTGASSGAERTARGGGHRSPPSDLGVTRREGFAPGERHTALGFRCVYPAP